MEWALEFREVSYSYNGFKVINNLSLSLASGEFVGLVGPNGSGKSTLLKLGNGVLEPQSGCVVLKGKELSAYSRREIAAQIATVPQVYHLEFNFTVEEVVAMGLYPKIKGSKSRLRAAKKVDEILFKMELDEMRERFFPELSGGERQRVILAQALAQEAEILFLDEPAANLDVSFQLKLFDFLRELNKQGMTVLCVVHDLNLALSYFERVALLVEGGILAEGIPEKVLEPVILEQVYGIKATLHNHGGKFFLTFSSPRLSGKLRGKVHLICGGGSGSFLMRELTEMGFLVTLGVVNALDTDEVTGRELGLTMAVEAPFSPIAEETFSENLSLIRQSEVVVLTRVPFGPGNLKNLEAAAVAAREGKPVWVVEKDLKERDFTGKASEMLSHLDGVKFFQSEDEILEELGKKCRN